MLQSSAGQRTTVDSGYSTSDSVDYSNRWSRFSQEVGAVDEFFLFLFNFFFYFFFYFFLFLFFYYYFFLPVAVDATAEFFFSRVYKKKSNQFTKTSFQTDNKINFCLLKLVFNGVFYVSFMINKISSDKNKYLKLSPIFHINLDLRGKKNPTIVVFPWTNHRKT